MAKLDKLTHVLWCQDLGEVDKCLFHAQGWKHLKQKTLEKKRRAFCTQIREHGLFSMNCLCVFCCLYCIRERSTLQPSKFGKYVVRTFSKYVRILSLTITLYQKKKITRHFYIYILPLPHHNAVPKKNYLSFLYLHSLSVGGHIHHLVGNTRSISYSALPTLAPLVLRLRAHYMRKKRPIH